MITNDYKSKDKRLEVSGFIMERTAKRMKQFFQRTLSEMDAGITADQWILLQVLDKEDGLSQLDLAQRTYKDAPTVTRIIDLLCKKELTERKANTADRRKFNICLTKKGRAKINEVIPTIKEFRKRIWKGLEPKELEEMTRILNTIFENME